MPTEPNCGMGGSTLTAGELVEALRAVPPDRPVTVEHPEGSWWLNVAGFRDLEEEQSLVLETTDDFDTRQF